jgi:hypothetical protein
MRDIDVRRKLRIEVEQSHRCEVDTLIIEELGLCQGVARVDLAAVNGSVHGYEIKSERDTLARLPRQTDIYNRTLDFVTIVCAPNHSQNIGTLVPRWWGLWATVEDGRDLRLEKLRESFRNTGVDPYALAQLLWRDEALEALRERDLASGLKSKPREELWRRLASELTLKELGNIVRDRLKRRGLDWRVLVSPV